MTDHASRSVNEPWRRRRLPDIIGPRTRVLFVGINPGVRSAETGHHFAGRSNRFCKLLYESGLVPEAITYRDDRRLREWGFGLTNLVARPSPGMAELRRHDYEAGARRLVRTLRRVRPAIVAPVGVTVYRAVCPEARRGRVALGRQRARLAGAVVFVLPNPSGRNAAFSWADMLHAFRGLRRAMNRAQP